MFSGSISVRRSISAETAPKKPRPTYEEGRYIQAFDGNWTPELEEAAINHWVELIENEGEDFERPQIPLERTLTLEAIARFVDGEFSLGDLLGMTGAEAFGIAQFGYNFMEGGKYEEAETIFKGLVVMVPKEPYFHTLLGANYHRQNKLDEAVGEYDAALSLNPRDLDALVNRGEILLNKGKLAEAYEDLQLAVTAFDVSPQVTRARSLLAMVVMVLEEALEGAKPAASQAEPDNRPRGTGAGTDGE